MTTPGFGGMGLLDSFMFGGGFEILFFLIFALVLCLFIVMIVRGVSQWHRNNNSPRLTVEATVVAKRIDVSHHHHGGETHHMDHLHPVLCHLSGGERVTGWSSPSVAGSMVSWWKGTRAA